MAQPEVAKLSLFVCLFVSLFPLFLLQMHILVNALWLVVHLLAMQSAAVGRLINPSESPENAGMLFYAAQNSCLVLQVPKFSPENMRDDYPLKKD